MVEFAVEMSGGFEKLPVAEEVAEACKRLAKQLDIGWWQQEPITIDLDKKGSKVSVTFTTETSKSSEEDAAYHGKAEGYFEGISAGARIPCRVDSHGGHGGPMFHTLEFSSIDDMVRFLDATTVKREEQIDTGRVRRVAKR